MWNILVIIKTNIMIFKKRDTPKYIDEFKKAKKNIKERNLF